MGRVISIERMRNALLAYLAIALCVVLAVACHRSSPSAEANARHYEVRGIVRGFAPDRSDVEVEHEKIPGFMPAMTMPFPVRDRNQLAGLGVGQAISFRLSVTERDSWIDHIEKIGADQVHLASPKIAPPKPTVDAFPRLREGDVLPPFELIDQDGKKISMETFRGRPLLLTFIFTRCPIPNFCPLMSKNFEQLQKAVLSGSGPVGQTRLLSISFDPGFDSPQVLKSYAKSVQADPKVWVFATGEKSEIDDLTRAFSVYVQTEGGSLSHGLATALIKPDGTIGKIWRGNGWTASEVVSEIDTNKN